MEWISVKDRLPERNHKYLVYGKVETNFLDYSFIGVAELWQVGVTGSQWRLDDFEAGDEDYITHWMPLPEAPKD